MRRFDDDRYYVTIDPELALLGTRGTLAQKRHRGEGPPYVKHGSRILYLGRDLNQYLDDHLIRPTATERGAPKSTDADGDGRADDTPCLGNR